MIIPSARRTLAIVVWLAAAVGGTLAAVHYHRLGLTLSHYDARGHLVVARRIIDSLTPGWQQIGAVWLPLPHLLNMLPVQIDAFYRTGASGVAISIVSFAIAAAAIAWIVQTLTGSAPAALAGVVVFVLNPNVLYLQATPMTEPLLLACTTLGVALLVEVSRTSGRHRRLDRSLDRAAGIVLSLACLTRYEAWPVTAAALVATLWALWRQGDNAVQACRRVSQIAAYPAATVLAFGVFSRVVVGQWFVASGFFVPENKALGHPILSAAEIWWGTHMLSGYAIVGVAAVGAAALAALGVFSRRHASALVALALGATAALPWTAFLRGHPFRVRYMVPLVAMEAVAAGVAAGLLPLFTTTTEFTESTKQELNFFSVRSVVSVVSVAIVAAVALVELHPLDAHAPMVVEAQWDRPNQPARARVTQCMGGPKPGVIIMASMGSLGHYMQEASRSGYNIRDFLHEGNGDVWLAALADGPRAYADWVLIEEKAEGGDMLAVRAREDPHFLDGYSRVCTGAGLVLYRRDADQKLTLTTKR